MRRHLDRRPFDLSADRAKLERILDERTVRRLIGDDQRLERIWNWRRQLCCPDLGHGMRGERCVAPNNAIVGRHPIVLCRASVDRIAGAELLEREADVEQLELIEEALTYAAASATPT